MPSPFIIYLSLLPFYLKSSQDWCECCLDPRTQTPFFTPSGLLREPYLDGSTPLSCCCSTSCPCAQHNISHCRPGELATVRLHLKPSSNARGLGVFAAQPIATGSPIVEYRGEIVEGGLEEARRRLDVYDAEGKGHALVVLQDSWGDGNKVKFRSFHAPMN